MVNGYDSSRGDAESDPPGPPDLAAAAAALARDLIERSVVPLTHIRVSPDAVEIEWATPPAQVDPATVTKQPVPLKQTSVAAGGSTGPILRAPAVGVFYLAPEPGAARFVDVGDTVEEGTQIGIVEAMKLMIPVQADEAGRIIEVLVEDGAQVEYDTALFRIQASGTGGSP